MPFQLQQLFGRLQLATHCKALTTRPLTKAFGWHSEELDKSSDESYQQQDSAEFLVLMLEALPTHVSSMFVGGMRDHVICTVCEEASYSRNPYNHLSIKITGVTDLDQVSCCCDSNVRALMIG